MALTSHIVALALVLKDVLEILQLIMIMKMEGGLPSDDEEVLLPYGKELQETRINSEYSESTVLPVHHQALLVQHQASPQAKNSERWPEHPLERAWENPFLFCISRSRLSLWAPLLQY